MTSFNLLRPISLRAQGLSSLQLSRYARSFSSQSQTDNILEKALPYVPKLGWSAALTSSIRDSGLSDQAASIFPNGPLDLVSYFHRAQLKELSGLEPPSPSSFADKLKFFSKARLAQNERLGFQLSESIRLLARLDNLPLSTKLLSEVSDEIVFLAGDRSNDTTWYTRRAGFGALYAAAEMFMSRDKSDGFKATYSFMNKGIDKLSSVQAAADNTSEWALFNGMACYNVARSLLR